MMNITQVKIFPVEEDKLKAFVSVVFDHCFMVNDIKVIQGKDGLFLSMPSRRKKSGEFKDVAHPLNNETRRMIEETVLTEYRSLVDDATPRRPDREDEVVAQAAHEAKEPARKPVARQAPATAQVPRHGDAGTNGSGRLHEPALAAAAESSARPVRQATQNGSQDVRRAAADQAAIGRAGEKGTGEDADENGEPTLEEVQEMHLSDSFWTVS